MKFGWKVVVALLALGVAAPVEAQYKFHNICSAGSLRVCASADVTIGESNNLIINVWNLSEPALGLTGRPTDMSSYSTPTGGWHTITAIGLANVNYTLDVKTYAWVDPQFYDGTNYTLLPKWLGVADASSLSLTNTGADVTGGSATDHREGIVGCYDPGPDGSGHAQTCSSYPVAPYVQFTLQGYGKMDLSNATFMFQSQQVAYEHCDPSNWDSQACLGNTVTASGAPTEVVPEPITLVLMGSGLVGVGAARRRRRKQESEAV